MSPTHEPGERLCVSGLAYLLGPPRRGDVVVVKFAGDRLLVLKRIGAVPGEEVRVGGRLQRLGDDEWFVVGDNESESTDSRQLGPVARRAILGQVLFKY